MKRTQKKPAKTQPPLVPPKRQKPNKIFPSAETQPPLREKILSRIRFFFRERALCPTATNFLLS